jgi:hypothetical protein
MAVRTKDPLVARPRMQLRAGVILLLVGAVIAAVAVRNDATVAAGPGYAIAVVGLILIGNSFLLRRRTGHSDDTGVRDGGQIRHGQ